MVHLSNKFAFRALLTIVLITCPLLFVSHSFVSRSHGQRNFFRQPQPSDNNIFFFEGTCAGNDMSSSQNNTVLHLNIMQSCAVESAARANLNMNIFLFSSCRIDENGMAKSSRMVQEILNKHKNVFVWHQSLESMFKNTDLEDFFHSKKMFDSPFKTQSSNVVRVLLLKIFGGTYLDLDFIVLRPFAAASPNFAGIESADLINSAALRFGLDAVGRRVADMFVSEIQQTYDGSIWGHNGPQLTTRILKKLCNVTEMVPRSETECNGFTVYEHGAFYPIHYSHWLRFYNENWTEEILNKTHDSIAVHLWNSMVRQGKSHKFPDQFRDSNQPIMVLQRKYCPISHRFNNVSKVATNS